MADKMSDADIRKELSALGEKSIGPITETTRPLYIKKLARLKSESKNTKHKSSRARPARKPTIGLSSDESEEEIESKPDVTSKKSVNRSRSLRSNTSLNVEPVAESSFSMNNSSFSYVKQPISHDRLNNSNVRDGKLSHTYRSRFNDTHRNILEDEPANKSAVIQTSFDSTFNGTMGYDDRFSPGEQEPRNEFSDSDREEVESSAKKWKKGGSTLMNTSRGNDSSRLYAPRFRSWKDIEKDMSGRRSQIDHRSQFIRSSTTGRDTGLRSRLRSSFPDQTGVMGTDGYKAKDNVSSYTWTQYISIVLVLIAITFFGLLAFMYISMQRGEDAREQESNLLLCDDKSNTEECHEKVRVDGALKVVREISTKLMYQAGMYECGYSDQRRLSIKQLEDHLKDRFGVNFGKGKDFAMDFLVALDLYVHNPQWNVKLYDGTGQETETSSAIASMEAVEASMSFLCRMRRSIDRIFRSLLLVVFVVLVVVLLLWFTRRRWRLQKQEQQQIFNLVEKIINILKDHHEACLTDKELEPYVAIVHIRDQLIPMRQRRKMQPLWEKAVKFLYENESRVREETQTIQGEEFAVWKWIQFNANGCKVWQGPAFGDNAESTSKLPSFMPLPCLKIRNMFDAESEYERDWHVKIQDAILEKCGPAHGIVHIAVDKKSTEGCVYVKCNSKEAAGRAFHALHGSWFNSRLVTVKFLRLERYHERFPAAAHCVKLLQPSDDSKSSLAQPFHKSFLEQY